MGFEQIELDHGRRSLPDCCKYYAGEVCDDGNNKDSSDNFPSFVLNTARHNHEQQMSSREGQRSSYFPFRHGSREDASDSAAGKDFEMSCPLAVAAYYSLNWLLAFVVLFFEGRIC